MSSTITALTSGGGLAMAGDTSGQLELKTNNGTTAVTVNTSQNVGIGTTSPATKLEVKGTHVSGKGLVNIIADSGTRYSTLSFTNDTTQKAIIFHDNTDNYLYVYASASQGINFTTNDTTRMLLTSAGNLQIGITTSPLPNNTGKITTYATSGSTAGWVSKGNANGYYGSLFENQSDTTVGYIQVNSTTTNFSTTSDYRLKENVAPMTGALNTVSLLKPVTYKWKEDGSDGQGFIAHELAEVMPDCVSGEKDAVKIVDELDEDGKVIGTKEVPQYQGIDTSFLVATLTAAIQELNAKVDAQALEIQALKGVA
jgi:hypothetical protein